MKYQHIISTLLSCYLILVSCEREQSVMSDTPITAQEKTIIVDGRPMYSGYGYDPVADRSYRNAIDRWSTFESTDIKEALTVEVEAIETTEQLERFVQSSYSVSSNFNIGIFSLGASIEKDIQNKITIDANHVTVIARIKSRSHKYICDRYPFLTDRADQLANNNDVNRFKGNFGLLYVDTRIVGGEVYYIYNYDYRQVNQWSKSVFRSKVTANIGSLFGINIGNGINVEDKQLISSAEKGAGITSTVPGFAPRIITDVNQINREIAALQSYLNNNPEKATTIEMNLRPFHSFLKYDYPSFAEKMEVAYDQYMATQN